MTPKRRWRRRPRLDSAAAGGLGSSLASRGGRSGERRNTSKRSSLHNPSRAIVMARREALSKRGKSASMPTSATAACVARQGNPDMSSRELAQKVRELKCKVGSAGCARSGGSRPTGPRRGKNRRTDRCSRRCPLEGGGE